MEWTVKELAERAGISGRALRYYHRIGLLQPDRVSGPTAIATTDPSRSHAYSTSFSFETQGWLLPRLPRYSTRRIPPTLR